VSSGIGGSSIDNMVNLKKIWKDNVGGNVIAGLIVAALVATLSLFGTLFAGIWPEIARALSTSWAFAHKTTEVPNWLLLVLVFGAFSVVPVIAFMAWQKSTPQSHPDCDLPAPHGGPSFEAWLHVKELKLFQIACLWDEKQPRLPITDDPEYARLQMLKEAVKNRELQPILNLEEAISLQASQYKPHDQTTVLRNDLREFAASRGLYPKFLFPCGPEGLAKAPTPPRDEVTGWRAAMLWYEKLRRIKTDDGTLLSQAIDGFVKAAYAGAIEVRGRELNSGQVVQIDREFWATASIDPLASMREDSDGGYASTIGSFPTGN
jgi:Flp pilus assembly pilin Flp